MMRKIIIGITFLASTHFLKSQSFGIQSLPVTPNASAIEKFVNQNVDYATGIPDISVPLYHITSGDINIPIYLKYNSSGVKVNENASNVGLGWSLSAGGAFSRTMVGIPDDYYNPIVFKGGFIYTQTPVSYIANANSYDAVTIQQNINENSYDAQADTFYYSLPHFSGKIAYNQTTHKFVEIPLSNNKITPVYNTSTKLIVGWEIIEPNGIKYIFGADENSKELSINNGVTITGGTGPLTLIPNSAIPNHYTNWHLSQVIDTKGNIVSFEYDTVSQIKQVSKGMLTKSREKISPTAYTFRDYNEKYLKKITFSTGYVIFNPDNIPRLDLHNSKRIAEMKVFSNSGQLIKKIKLNHSYFIGDLSSSGDSFAYTSFPITNQTHRLKLDSIEESYNDGNQQQKKYRFEYDETVLPHKSSYSMDYWGFYNGELNNSLFPRMLFQYGTNLLEDGNAERSVNSNFITAGMLRKIIYPTGGSTEYEFEPNTASTFDFLPQNDTAQLSVVNIKSSYQKRSYTINKTTSTFQNNIFRYWEFPFTINSKLHSNLQLENFQINGCPVNTVDPGGNHIGGCNYIYSLLNANDQPINLSSGQWINLPTGNYKIKIQYMGLPEPYYESQSDFNLNLTIKEDLQPLIKRVGGLRVKEIRSYINDNELKYKKYFNYNYFDSEGKELSSGYTFLPTYGVYGHITMAVGDVMYSDNVYSFLTVGNTAYSKVTEYTEDVINHSTQKILHTFETNGNTGVSPTLSYGCPNCVWIMNMNNADNNWERKKNKGETVYKTNSYGLFEEIRKTNYTYDYLHLNQTREFFPAGFYSMQFPVTGSSTNGVISGFYYNYTNNMRILTKKEKKLFSLNEAETQENFSYGQNIFMPIKKTILFPDNIVSETSYQYAHEKGNTKLINANMIGIPLETNTIRKQNASDPGKTISRTETKYDDPSNLFPTSVMSYDLQNAASTELTYDQYDSKGNLLQYTTKSGIPTAIIWGYNNTQPIAKIEGATYSQVSSLAAAIIFASDSDAANPANEPALITALDNFRKDASLAGMQITTYTYDPLIGVTSITPPSGIREVYIYDTANRLEKIVDINGKVLKEFKYNYKP